MDTVLHRTLTIMEDSFDINSIEQQNVFKASLLVYGRGQRLIYTKRGNKQQSKALWVASDLSDWGPLESQYYIVTTRQTKIQVGPWEGWDSSISSLYSQIHFGSSFWHLCHHYQEAFSVRKNPGRSASYAIRHEADPGMTLYQVRQWLMNG